MKILVVIVRILMGLLFVMSSVVVLFSLMPIPEMQGKEKLFNEGLAAAGYLVPVLKVIELVCGLLFISGRFVPLATVVIFPIVLNIFLYHAFISPQGLPVAIFLLLGNLFLAYVHRDKYRTVFAVK